jgi:UDP-N-acetylglucosamine--N-acetylmuramyl-(pentapeptide) pyrophosphoryl-undecaprenol N-acetylglucosamine transferase
MASLLGAKIVLLEQNSFPGVTNRMLENKAASIHLSFEDSAQYFKNKSKLKMTGNPVRTTLKLINKKEAIKSFGFDTDKKVLFVMGGSLGARVINRSVEQNIEIFIKNKIQLIWQTGELYYDEYKKMENESIRIFPFISEMEKAFSASDLLVARAGATTIAEAAYLGLPVIFIPSTNVAANHQYKNAKSLVENNAGLMIEDSKLKLDFGKMILETITDQKLLLTLINNIKKFSKPEAAHDIAMDVLRLAEQNKN